MKIGIYIINLKDGSLRKKHMISQMEMFGISNYNFIDAVDGRKKKAISFDEYDNLTILKTGKVLSSTEVACFLSHLKAINTAYIDDVDYAIILEDDVYLTKYFKRFIDDVELYMDNYNLLRLLNYKKPFNVSKPIEFKLRTNLGNWGGAHGYVVDKKAMQYISNKFFTKQKFIRRKFDNFLWTYQLPLIIGDTNNSIIEIKDEIISDIGYDKKLKKFIPSRIMFDIYNYIRGFVFKIFVFPLIKTYTAIKEIFI